MNEIQATMPRLALTVPEAATELRIGRNATYQLIREGRLRALRIGQRIVVPQGAILDFLGEEQQ